MSARVLPYNPADVVRRAVVAKMAMGWDEGIAWSHVRSHAEGILMPSTEEQQARSTEPCKRHHWLLAWERGP